MEKLGVRFRVPGVRARHLDRGLTNEGTLASARPGAPGRSRCNAAEVVATVQEGESFAAKFGRTGFRRNFAFGGEWQGRRYATKQVEAYAVDENGWLVITVIVKYF